MAEHLWSAVKFFVTAVAFLTFISVVTISAQMLIDRYLHPTGRDDG